MRALLIALTLLGLAVAATVAQDSPASAGIGPHGKKLYQFMVFSNPTPGMEDEYNHWYDRIHAPVMIEAGDFIAAQRFAYSPVQLGGSELPKRAYMVMFTIETDDIARVAADVLRRMNQPRNVRSNALDYKSLLSYTFVALGPPITQKDAQRLLQEEQAAGSVPAAGAAPGKP
jgi:hypothetical protein